ncbi:MAG TPA: hypothetical protein DD477_01600 [Spirochaetaceae bacterium]|nr:hypothetical protein [Spirochaetaceae bacterium]HAX37424.1 hypothetical protein [Spirochaetaceae bacterium]HBO39898.1 hypothetical protein [Spirochaetaceae bacterium]HCQ88129.1 hypothetical protein [Spirochaetaceae bacterium]
MPDSPLLATGTQITKQTGAEASCRVFSLIETAKLNGQEPYAYLLAVLNSLPQVRQSGDWNSLLPWNRLENGKN